MRLRYIIALLFVTVLGVYAVSYFWCSEPYYGMWEQRQIRFRLFDHQWQMTFWKPLLILERSCTSVEFSGHVRAGATLPPAWPSEAAVSTNHE